jgi:hypothetical protein
MKHLKPFNENFDRKLFGNKHFQEIFYEVEDVFGANIKTEFNDMYYFITLEYPENEFNIFQTHSTDTIDTQLSLLEQLREIIISSKKILMKLQSEDYEATYKIDNGKSFSVTFWIKRDFED